MANQECLICHEIYDEKLFHKHVRYEHDKLLSDYYVEVYNKVDLFTKEPIPFKTTDQYFTTFYLNKVNLKQHLKSISLEEASKVCQDILAAYKQYKHYQYAPTQTEARSKLLPPPSLILSIGLNYSKICEKVGLISKFDYEVIPEFNESLTLSYLMDTREKKVLPLPVSKVTKLNYGDIAADRNPFGIYIERKNPNDLTATMTSGLDRFKREIERATTKKDYLIVLCERPIKELMSVEYQKYSYGRVKGEYLFHNIRDVCQNFPSVQFAFCNGREHMVKVIDKIYKSKTNPRRLDLQYLIDKKVL